MYGKQKSLGCRSYHISMLRSVFGWYVSEPASFFMQRTQLSGSGVAPFTDAWWPSPDFQGRIVDKSPFILTPRSASSGEEST